MTILMILFLIWLIIALLVALFVRGFIQSQGGSNLLFALIIAAIWPGWLPVLLWHAFKKQLR